MGLQDVLIEAHQPVDGVVVHLALLAVLDGQLQQLDLLGAGLQAPVQNHRLEELKARAGGRQLPQAGEAAVAVDDPAVVERHAGLPLVHQLDVGAGLPQGLRVALHNKALNDGVIGLPVLRVRGLPAVLGAVLADPGGDAVVLVVVVQPVQPDFIDRIGLRDAVDGQLSGQTGGNHSVLRHAVLQ